MELVLEFFSLRRSLISTYINVLFSSFVVDILDEGRDVLHVDEIAYLIIEQDVNDLDLHNFEGILFTFVNIWSNDTEAKC